MQPYATAVIVTVLMLSSAPQETPPASEPARLGAATTSRPASQPARSQRKPTQTKVLEELIRQTERPAPILSQLPGAGASPGATNPALMLEGQALVERAGRFVQSGERPEFQIKLDTAEKKPGSFPLNANSLLELLERDAAAGNTEFIVSGWVSVYRGQNYLTLTKVRRQVPNGNIAP